MRFSYLYYVSRALPKKYNRWYSAGDQIVLSALSLLFSLTVVKISGVERFGVYSFVFLFCQLSGAVSSTLIVRQMVLYISDEVLEKQKQAFVETVFITLIFFLLKTALVFAMLLTMFEYVLTDYFSLFVGAVLYALSLDLYDLFRQYMYVRNKQRLSFLYTVFGATASIGLLLLFVLQTSSNEMYKALFVALTAGMLCSICLNGGVLSDFLKSLRYKKFHVVATFKEYLKSGKIALLGMLVTWVQNQSLTPILMFLSGPLVVGYYNLAKMCFMPVGVIISGFSKSVLPKLRRLYKSSGSRDLLIEVKRLQNIALAITSMYFLVVLVLAAIVINLDVVSLRPEHFIYIVCTGVIVSLSTFRFWLTQYFVAKMDFRLLLRAGILGALVSVSLMFLFDYTFGSVVLVITSVALAELLVVLKLRRSVSI